LTAPSAEILDLFDWRRRVSALYAEVRESEDPVAAWDRWREVRHDLLASHPQSPIPPDRLGGFEGATYFPYDPAYRVTATVEPAEPQRHELPGSAGATFGASRFAKAGFALLGEPLELGLYWLEGYAGGVFLAFRDETSGRETYGACRYLLDTVKGADLGGESEALILDFNFSYNPSCSYDPRWACPLAPQDNRLPIAVRAGERYG
jgi:uncharacterized protein (DUF1684 family)